jgi:hypothetical protein
VAPTSQIAIFPFLLVQVARSSTRLERPGPYKVRIRENPMSMEAAGVAAEERWASLCNCVVNFLLEEKYHLTALELLQELQEDGRHAQALRLRSFFSDPAFFPPDLVARASSAPPGTAISPSLRCAS